MGIRNVDQNLVRERVKAIMDELGFNPNAFATWLGTDPSNFTKKLKGILNFTDKDIENFERHNINSSFILLGDGRMFNGDIKRYTSEDKSVVRGSGVPVFEEEFACGFMLDISDTPVTPVGYVDIPGYKSATCWCKATGDSMQPLINNGDYICLRKFYDWDFIIYGDVYAIDTVNDMRTIKRIDKGESDDEYMLVPVNKEYSPQPIKKAQIRNLFRVLGVTKFL